MANAERGSPLRRWRPIYGAFDAIDDAIEQAAGGHPRAAFRNVRVRIVQLLRGATDDAVAEQLCAALDDAMAEALQTLRVLSAPHSALASTDLTRAVGALAKHGSPRIRRLAGDVVRGWRAANVATPAAVKEEPDMLSADDRIPRLGVSAAIADGHEEKLHVQPAKMLAAAEVKLHMSVAKEILKNKVHVPPAKMLPTAATVLKPSTSETKKPVIAESEKMKATKRKLREGYYEAMRIKCQHSIQMIDDDEVATKMFEQKQRKMHPRAGVRRSLLHSLMI